MKLAILGGGGFRTPFVCSALAAASDRLRFEDVVLQDLDPTRLARIGAVLAGIAEEGGETIGLRTTTSLEDALEGADFVFSAIRVGGLEARVIDETVPLAYDVLGQETTGPGGIFFALRTVPVVVAIAEQVARLAPRAWFVNFTNPAGLVTEALRPVLGERAIGICDSPAALCRRVAAALGRSPDELWFDYFGLNHLGWLRAVRDGERDLLPELLADDERLGSFEEGRLFGGEWLRSLELIPNEYLAYYYFAPELVAAIRERGFGRAEELLGQQRAFYDSDGHGPADALAAWRRAQAERERTYMGEARIAAGVTGGGERSSEGYEGVALAVVEAIARDQRTVLILDVANRGSLPFLDADAVVEVPCVVGATGAYPLAVGDVPLHARALIEALKDVERTTVEAALTGSRRLVLRALALHPLVGSVATARRMLDRYLERQPALRERLG